MSKQSYTSSILITGGTQGLGYHCALNLAKQLPQTLIVIASRTDSNNAATTINTKLTQINVKYMPLDLGSLESTRSFASTWSSSSFPPISALLLNAGLQLPGAITYTPDGIEKHFGVNHVAHALLFHLLTPNLTSDARIIVTTSGLHDPVQGKKWGIMTRYTTPSAVANPAGVDLKWNGRERYATSKSANAIWAFALGRHLQAQGSAKTVLAFDPGLMFGTNFARDASAPVKVLNNYVLPRLTPLMRVVVNDNINTPAESGGNLAWLITAKETQGKNGVYYEKRGEREASNQARSRECQEELWGWTVEKVAQGAEERERFRRAD